MQGDVIEAACCLDMTSDSNDQVRKDLLLGDVVVGNAWRREGSLILRYFVHEEEVAIVLILHTLRNTIPSSTP